MASVSWIYPQDELIALHRQNAEGRRYRRQSQQPSTSTACTFVTRSKATIHRGVPFVPLMMGAKCTSSFLRGIGQGEMPLFIVGPEGKTSELVNYRVRGSHMIVDRLFAAAELRLGDGASEQRRAHRPPASGGLFW